MSTSASTPTPVMLLPAAFPCDSSQSTMPRLQSALFASPPASPPALSSHNAFGNIVSTCRSLQSLITAAPPMAVDELPSFVQLPTPPMAHAPSPMKLRLRSRNMLADSPADEHRPSRRRITKRAPPPPHRGANKRRRGTDDEGDLDEDVDSDLDLARHTDSDEQQQRQPVAPTTPKRARIAPEQLPLGLERADFHDMHLLQPADSQPQPRGTDVEVEADGEEWSAEDDRILVELVLEKLKLSKSEWQDCARSLGKDRHSVGRRWKSLMAHGDIGVKTRSSSRRAKLHSTWR